MSVPSFICMVLDRFLGFRGRYFAFVSVDSATCVALLANTTIRCNKRCQGSLNIIQILAWNGPKTIKNETSGRFGGVLGALGFSNAFLEHHVQICSILLAPFGRCCLPFWRPLYFEGPIRLVFLDVSRRSHKNNKCISNNCTAKAGECNTTKNRDKTIVQST